jgi:Syntaxin 6, N-terminal
MSTDPYHAVQREIQASLQTAAQLHASYIRIRSTAREDSEELTWAKSEVCVSFCSVSSNIGSEPVHTSKRHSSLANFFFLVESNT